MNRLVSHISKSLALLSVALLPVQQFLSSNCCCQANQSVHQTIAESPATCCSPYRTNWSSSTRSSPEQSCCASSSDSKSKPCECAKNAKKLTAPDPAATEWSSADEPTSFARNSISTAATLCTATDLAADPIVASESRVSALDRCAQLCRFLL